VRLNIADYLVTNTKGVFSYKHVRTWTRFRCVPRDSALGLKCSVRVLATASSCSGLHDQLEVRRSACRRFLSDSCRFMSQSEVVGDEFDKVWQEMICPDAREGLGKTSRTSCKSSEKS